MNFINKYLKDNEASRYNYAEVFSEYDAPVTYAVGDFLGKPVITKVNQDGIPIWEKTYDLGLVEISYSFRKIIRLNDFIWEPNKDQPDFSIDSSNDLLVENRDVAVSDIAVGEERPIRNPVRQPAVPAPIQNCYVLHVSDGSRHWLLSIDEFGDVRWCNEVFWPDSDIMFHLEPVRGEGMGFYVAISDRGQQDSGLQPFVGRFDSFGNFLFSRRLYMSGSEHEVTMARSHTWGISITGRHFVGGLSLGYVMTLDLNLNVLSAFSIKNPELTFHDLIVRTPFDIYLSGYAHRAQSLFVTYLDEAQTHPLYLLPKTNNHGSRLAWGIKGFYLLQYNSDGGILHNISTSFSIRWSQTLEMGFPGQGNGIEYINYNNLFGKLVTNTLEQSSIMAPSSSLVQTDSNFTSCKTIELARPNFISEKFDRTGIGYELGEYGFDMKYQSVSTQVLNPGIQEHCPADDPGVFIDKDTSVQSPHFYLQAAGSTGADGSAQGIHLRWMLAGALGNKHLPKGNLATSLVNFNRQNDFVKLYRAPYKQLMVTLDMTAPPYLVDDANKVFLYRVGDKVFYVYFRNRVKYDQVRATVNPMTNALTFLQGYGFELIEVENKKELFFYAHPRFSNSNTTSTLRAETISVGENALAATRRTSSRKTYRNFRSNPVQLVCENGRSVRLRPNNCLVTAIDFEFYTDFINDASRNRAWQLIDKYSLTNNDGVAFTRLEPVAGLVDGKWPRYNDSAFVNTDNYKTKWNGPRPAWDRNIKDVVQNYINLSNSAGNPRGLEYVPLESGGNGGADDMLEISNLDLLNVASYDFHVARMLGLGTLDYNSTVWSGKWVYIALYTTTGDLEDGFGARLVKHMFMSLPVATTDQRLPLPVELKEIVPGTFWGTDSPEPVNLTDVNGYTPDGRIRYVTLYSESLPEEELNKNFYYLTREFNNAEITYPVYAGLEYRKNNDTGWIKPELPNDPRFQNRVPAGQQPHNETIALGLPEPQKPLFVHPQRVSGMHYYSGYGINWFSRANAGAVILSVETEIKPLNPLKPPSNINALLIRPEAPLLLTSSHEQTRYNGNPNTADKTLVRLTFDYHAHHELLSYAVAPGANVNDPNVIPADNTEIFAEEVEIFFRNGMPGNVTGKITAVDPHPTNSILSVISTGTYVQTSNNTMLVPAIPSGMANNYVGGLFILQNEQFIIHQVTQPFGQGPQFTVFKKEIRDGVAVDGIPSPNAQQLLAPEMNPDGLFMAVENMLNPGSWNTGNPMSFKVQVGVGQSVNRELITIVNDDGTTEQQLEKTRGVWDNADIQKVNEPAQDPNNPGGIIQVHKGMYKFTFQNVALAQHPQFNNNGLSVEWYQGIVRAKTVGQPNGERRLLKVARIENVGTSSTLVVYAYDPGFSTATGYDPVQIGVVRTNFYPGYRAYLYANTVVNLTQTATLPAAGEGVRYSIFGLRSRDVQENFVSSISTPQPMFAQEQVAAQTPEEPQGPLYATRPDFFGRSTYSFTTRYTHKPHGVLFYRSNDEALLNAIYKEETIKQIRASLKALGGNDEPFLANRWRNFLDFAQIAADGDYKTYPPVGQPGGYKFPNPDKQAFFDWANSILAKLNQPLITETPGTLPAGHVKIREFVKGVIFTTFVPLTEVPIIYQHIKGGAYQPAGKKQNIRDKYGLLLPPTDSAFDMAPMMKVTGGAGHETLFTDFTLDGTSNNIYFYGVRELDTQMKMGDFSPFLGPVKLVNSNPPEAPEVKRIMPVIENAILGTDPAVQLEINAYPEIQKVKKVHVYRATSQLDAQSVRSMKLVKTVDLEAAGLLTEAVWTVEDDFTDLPEVPYNDGLYYRLTVAREVEYADKDGNILTEYAPSLPSKLAASLIVEASNPPAPELTFTSDPMTPAGVLNNVSLQWNKMAYKAKYHVYKMNASGNWSKIHELTTNNSTVNLALNVTTLQSGTLQTKDTNGNNIYHHFKVVTENTSGMLSLEEKILTIPGA
jgi:hypothetical protein